MQCLVVFPGFVMHIVKKNLKNTLLYASKSRIKIVTAIQTIHVSDSKIKLNKKKICGKVVSINFILLICFVSVSKLNLNFFAEDISLFSSFKLRKNIFFRESDKKPNIRKDFISLKYHLGSEGWLDPVYYHGDFPSISFLLC